MATNPTLLKMPLARDGQKSTIPETTDGTTGLFSEQYGWQSINSLPLQAGGKAVKREDFNGAFNLLGGVAFYAQKGWTFIYDTTQAYYAGCVVADVLDGNRYTCIADVAAGQGNPSEDTTLSHWLLSEVAENPYYYRQSGKAYASGDIARDPSFPSWVFLECKVGGTTDTGVMTVPAVVEENVEVSDGTVTWKIKRTGGADGVPLGVILPLAHNGTIPSGYLLCDGRAVSRTMFPDLFSAIGTTYGVGDGSTTFNLPDANQAKRFLQGDVTAGTAISAGLPNITGSATSFAGASGNTYSGAITTAWVSNSNLNFASGAEGFKTMSFDASRSSAIYGNSTTVQPNALTTRYIIKAFDGQTADSALIDITQYANELAGKADRSLSNLTDAGKSFSFPSDTNVTISLSGGTAGTSYTPPADGYISFAGTSIGTGSFVNIRGIGQATSCASSAGLTVAVFISVKRGVSYTLIYANLSSVAAVFHYAQGEVPV